LAAAAALLLLIAWPVEGLAQMFGQRTLGRPLSRRAPTGPTTQSQEDVGQLQGTERFLRGNRSLQDFVGADTRERGGFVGEQAAAASGAVVSAVRDLRPRREMNLNQPLRASRSSQLYHPRLRVDFSFDRLSGEQLGARIRDQLQVTETLGLQGPIEVSVAAGTATLRGAVASAHDREMAELLVRFEPGISTVINELAVQPPSPSDRPPPDSRRSSSEPD
jgi:hypothetical protein